MASNHVQPSCIRSIVVFCSDTFVKKFCNLIYNLTNKTTLATLLIFWKINILIIY